MKIFTIFQFNSLSFNKILHFVHSINMQILNILVLKHIICINYLILFVATIIIPITIPLFIFRVIFHFQLIIK